MKLIKTETEQLSRCTGNATDRMTEGWGSIFCREIDVYPLQSAQTGFGFYPASYLMENGDYFPKLKQSKHEDDHLNIVSNA